MHFPAFNVADRGILAIFDLFFRQLSGCSQINYCGKSYEIDSTYSDDNDQPAVCLAAWRKLVSALVVERPPRWQESRRGSACIDGREPTTPARSRTKAKTGQAECNQATTDTQKTAAPPRIPQTQKRRHEAAPPCAHPPFAHHFPTTQASRPPSHQAAAPLRAAPG